MIRVELYNKNGRRWVYFGRDPSKSPNIIDTNQYLITHGGRGLVLDPGGIEVFPAMIAALTAEIQLEDIDVLFASHQDPDIVSSLFLWLDAKPDVKVVAPWVWSLFIPHFGGGKPVTGLPDASAPLPLGGSTDLITVPQHYCHASGHLGVYDPEAKILFSSDLGAALTPPGMDAIYVENFAQHVQHMEGFHKRWLPSNKAKNDWVRRVRQLDVQLMCPQHGAMFKGDDVKRYLDWLEGLDVGVAVA